MFRTLSPFLLACCVLNPLRAEAPPEEFKLSPDEQAVVDATNIERKKADLPPVAPNPQLFAAARGHAANMAKQDMLEHTLDDKTPGDRVKAAGYRFAMTGENIAKNTRTPQKTLDAWMDSEGHKKNILTKEYTEIGVAVAKNDKGEPYWVQVFGKPLSRK